ncbi:MAG: ComEC/Rec2 family competence protein [Bacteroidales bacterium]|nr:ComEC/Rec2 family competence protein [Bacteroidales bacterium]
MRRSLTEISLSFTAGVAIGALASSGAEDWRILYIVSGLCCAGVAAALVAYLSGRLKSDWLLLPLFFFTGLFCFLTKEFTPSPPSATLLALRKAGKRFCEFIDTIPFGKEGTGALLKALLAGDRSGLPRETVRIFRASGASHLLALSGLHLGIIYLVLKRLGMVFGNSPAARVLRSAAVVTASLLYAFATGASPSIVRAFLFITLHETASLSGRKTRPSLILAGALLIQLVLDPLQIRAIGFQLSYCAIAGIVIIYPRLSAWYPSGRFDPLKKIWDSAVLSIACQAFTAPLAWYYFHTFPRHFLLTNLMAIPLTTALMLTALSTVVLSACGICPALFVQATDFLASTLVETLRIISLM